jgi:site-specific recombinase XerD
LNIFTQFVENKPAREVTVQDIDAFIEKQSQRQLKPATINRRLAAISGYFEFLILEQKRMAGAIRSSGNGTVSDKGTIYPVTSMKIQWPPCGP